MRSQASRIHYFDYNATHPPLMDVILPVYQQYGLEFFNPSGASRFSLSNQGKIEEARKFFSSNDDYPANGHIFSSSGTEANHILISAVRNKYPDIDAIYTSSSEHSSFYSALEFYRFQPILVGTDKSGTIDIQELQSRMELRPLPIGVIYAVNETGVIQPMEDLSRIARSYEMPLISDCMQAFGKILISYTCLDGYTCSGHKIGAGMGASLTALNHKLISQSIPFIKGGNQENGLRAGTENLPAIQAFAEVANLQLGNWGGTIFHNILIQRELTKFLKPLGIHIVAESSQRLPNTLFVILPIEDLDFFLMGMEGKNIIVSTGSSCKSRAREASSTLLRMGYSEEEALRAIRISWGSETTQEDVEALQSGILDLLGVL